MRQKYLADHRADVNRMPIFRAEDRRPVDIRLMVSQVFLPTHDVDNFRDEVRYTSISIVFSRELNRPNCPMRC